jgi:hypothetical protein
MTTMKSIRRAAGVSLALAALLAAPGCEKTEPTAEPNSVLVLSANPGNINFGNSTSGSSTITAELYSSSGSPRSGVGIRFSTDIGSMESGGDSIKTDGSGVARDVLHVSDSDAGGFAVVTGRSGSVNGTVDVAVGIPNEPPEAVILLNGIDTSGRARPGDRILYDGTFSSDPEDTNPSYFRWQIFSTDPASNEVVEGDLRSASQFERVYNDPQDITVQLIVEDSLGATSAPAADFFTVIDNLPPVAEAGSDRRVELGSILLTNGAGSSDPDGTVVSWEWDWDDGIINTLPQPNGSHLYLVAAVYCVQLIVTDDDGARSEPDFLKACIYPDGEPEPQQWCTDPIRDRVCF